MPARSGSTKRLEWTATDGGSFKRFAVRLRSRSLEGLDIEVVAEGDLNYNGS